jgi:sRNA-binding regulator protein Hfq
MPSNAMYLTKPQDEAVRREQMEFARSQQRDDSRQPRQVNTLRKNPNNPLKGHQAFLKALETSGVDVIFMKASDGSEVRGTVKAADNFTVSVKVTQPDGSYITRVLFKHDISEFTPIVTAEAKAH